MFPDDNADGDTHDMLGEEGTCTSCGCYHGDISDAVSAYVRELGGGFVSSFQVMSAIRAMILLMRQMQYPDVISLLVQREIHLVEQYLREHDYKIHKQNGTMEDFLTVEKRQEMADEVDSILADGIPDFIPENMEDPND